MENNISENEIQLNIEVSDWEEAIRKGAAPLLLEGKISSEYVDEMIDSVHTQGPYIVIAPGIAIGHAQPSAKVKKTGISISSLKKPVKFGSKTNDPVDLVIILASIDSTNHLGMLQKIVTFLGNSENLSLLRSASTNEDKQMIVNLINERRTS